VGRAVCNEDAFVFQDLVCSVNGKDAGVAVRKAALGVCGSIMLSHLSVLEFVFKKRPSADKKEKSTYRIVCFVQTVTLTNIHMYTHARTHMHAHTGACGVLC
jgi:hypothetical protein